MFKPLLTQGLFLLPGPDSGRLGTGRAGVKVAPALPIIFMLSNTSTLRLVRN